MCIQRLPIGFEGFQKYFCGSSLYVNNIIYFFLKSEVHIKHRDILMKTYFLLVYYQISDSVIRHISRVYLFFFRSQTQLLLFFLLNLWFLISLANLCPRKKAQYFIANKTLLTCWYWNKMHFLFLKHTSNFYLLLIV